MHESKLLHRLQHYCVTQDEILSASRKNDAGPTDSYHDFQFHVRNRVGQIVGNFSEAEEAIAVAEDLDRERGRETESRPMSYRIYDDFE